MVGPYENVKHAGKKQTTEDANNAGLGKTNGWITGMAFWCVLGRLWWEKCEFWKKVRLVSSVIGLAWLCIALRWHFLCCVDWHQTKNPKGLDPGDKSVTGIFTVDGWNGQPLPATARGVFGYGSVDHVHMYTTEDMSEHLVEIQLSMTFQISSTQALQLCDCADVTLTGYAPSLLPSHVSFGCARKTILSTNSVMVSHGQTHQRCHTVRCLSCDDSPSV